MKLINSSVEVMPQEAGLQGIYKQIEKCGRTCYKSTDKITDDSAKPFVDRMIASEHTAMLEQSAVYLKVPRDDFNRIVDDHDFAFWNNPYSYFNGVDYSNYMCISTNLRVLYEYHYMELLDFVVDPSEDEFKKKVFERRVTVKFICDRGVSHELVRHKLLCVA
jgi:thymidylate synthase (FAD)